MDKLVHVGLFLGFAVLWAEALPEKFRRYLWVAVAGLTLAVISELGQLFPAVRRDAEFADAAADFFGVLVGLCVFRLLDELRKMWSGRHVAAGTAR
jgi:VanZ family protein